MESALQRWQRLVADWRASGLTQDEFAERANINATLLVLWERGLTEFEPEDGPEDLGGASLEFVELGELGRLVSREAGTAAAGDVDPSIVLEVGEYRLSVMRGFERDVLHEVLDTLEERLS